jgi:glutathione S-transferase
MLTLFAAPTSPYARKVRIALAEKKVEYALVNESPWTAETTVPTSNPLGKVPVLVLDDGSCLHSAHCRARFREAGVAVDSRVRPPADRGAGKRRRRRMR